VTVGGQAAPVTSIGYEGTPFPTQGLVFTVPPGAPGSSVDVTVTTASGSVTVTGAFHYVAATKFYPLTATLQQGIYDPNRNVYYFTDQTKIQVFSASTGQWLSPITLPNVTAQTQLVGLSLLPDGSKMAVADFGDETVYVLDPTQPNSAQEFPVLADDEGIASPCGLAIAANGLVYYASADINGTGANAFHVLDTVTGVTTDIPEIVNGGGLSDDFDRVFLSPDGTRAYSNAGGSPFWMDTGTDVVTYPSLSLLGPGSPDFAMSADGTTFAADGYLTDAYLNPFSMVAYIDRELFFPTAVYGQKLSKDGALLFQPLTDGIDVLDSQGGRLLYRVQLPIQISNTYDALVSDGDDTLVAITNGGIAFIDLSSLPLPQTRHDKTEAASRRAPGATRLQTKRKGIPRSNVPRLRYRDDSKATRQSQRRLP
jgi:hypothetical protein